MSNKAASHPFPPAPAGQKRFMIYLEEKPDEDDLQVKLIAGRMEKVDGCNRHFIGGKIEEKTLQGWGYNYYDVTMGPTAGTLMMPLGEAAEKKEKFVSINNEEFVRYNSKLPIVVYAPENAIIRYKVVGVVLGGQDGITAKEQ